MNKTEEKKLARLEAEVERLTNEEVEMLTAYRQKHMEKCRAIKEKNQYKLYLNDKSLRKEREEFKKKVERADKKNLKDIERLIKKIGAEEALRRLTDI